MKLPSKFLFYSIRNRSKRLLLSINATNVTNVEFTLNLPLNFDIISNQYRWLILESYCTTDICTIKRINKIIASLLISYDYVTLRNCDNIDNDNRSFNDPQIIFQFHLNF